MLGVWYLLSDKGSIFFVDCRNPTPRIFFLYLLSFNPFLLSFLSYYFARPALFFRFCLFLLALLVFVVPPPLRTGSSVDMRCRGGEGARPFAVN